MEKTNVSVVTRGTINGFDYIQINDVKYFIGDFIKITQNPKEKWKIVTFNTVSQPNKTEFYRIGLINNKKQIAEVLCENVLEFYYKKDYKKYFLQKKKRVYENDPDIMVKDCFGSEDKLSNMIVYQGKLVSKSNCVQVYTGYDESIIIVPKTEVMKYGVYASYTQCYINGIYYPYNKIKNAYIANLVDNPEIITESNIHALTSFTKVFVNNNDFCNLLTIPSKYFPNLGSTDSQSKLFLINGKEFLEAYKKIFIIGPKSGMIVRKDRLKKDDNYCQYPNGYYFPEFSNLQDKTNDINHNYRFGLDSNTHLITEGLKYTFGVEIEMADCCFPPHFFTDMNIKVEKDGSIKNTRGEKYGPEVITGVLKGDKGFEHLQYICTELAKRSEINYTCGIHTHIGNANFNNANIVMLFKLAKALEKDIFNMLPASRGNNEYCRKLPNLDFNFNNCTSVMDLKIRIDNYYTELFTLAADCPPSDKVNKTKNHPRGAKVGYNHSNIRYCWINFIPALFNTRNTNPPCYTVEFRPFNASTNFIKIKNWIKICMAIVNFSENYHKDIINNYIMFDNNKEPITLKNVIKKVYPKSYRKLNEFIDSRTQIFSATADEDNDVESTDQKLNIKQLIS